MSALFDEWAYQEMYKASPELKPAKEVEPVNFEPLNTALEFKVGIPSPQLKPRSQTLSAPALPPLALPAQSCDAPLTSKSEKLNVDSWLGSAHPKNYNFSESLWQVQVRDFEKVRLDLELSTTVCKNMIHDLQFLNHNNAYIAQEIGDIQEHDLQPLLVHTAELDRIEAQKQLIADIKQAHYTGWGTYPKVQKVLHQPAKKVVPHLVSLMQDIHAGLEFCKLHKEFVDIGQMELSWRSSAQRTLQITVSYCVHELKRIANRITEKLKTNANLQSTLLYTKFVQDTSHLTLLALIVKVNSDTEEQELQHWFVELQNSYFTIRTSLLQPLINEYVAKVSAHSAITDEFNDTVRSTLLQFKQLYEQEFQIFTQIFGDSTPEFWMWLRDISDSLYAAVRRLIVRETDIGKLCKLTFLIHSHNEEEIEEESPMNSDFADKQRAQAHLEDPFDVLYMDAQKRLVFRAGMLIDSFEKYKPSSKDFSREQFPVLTQTLDLLSQVYQLLNSKVFNDLAQRCVRECLLCLDSAVANQVASQPQKGYKLHLFHVKQLLILQTKIVDFDLENVVVQDVDFGGVFRLLQLPRGKSFREMLNLAWDSVPHVVAVMMDAMEETYASFRTAVDRLCASFATDLVSVLKSDIPEIAESNAEFRTSAVSAFKQLKTEINENISDANIANVLVDAVQDKVLDEYTKYYRNLPLGVASTEGVMDIDTMAVWLSDALTN